MTQNDQNYLLSDSLSNQLNAVNTKMTASLSWYGYLRNSRTSLSRLDVSESSYLRITHSISRLDQSLQILAIELAGLESKFPIGKPVNTSFTNYLKIMGIGNQLESQDYGGSNEANCSAENFEQLELFPGMP